MKWLLLVALALSAPAWVAVGQTPRGTYNGLFFESSGVAVQSAGSFTLTAGTKPGFSGKILLAGATVPLKGSFTNGQCSLSVPRKSLSTLNIELTLSGDTNTITGTVSDGTWTADLLAERAPYDGKISIAPQAGRYTLIIPGDVEEDDEPAGDSSGTISVDNAGRISLAGTLADGTKLTQASAVSWNGRWAFFVSPYANRGLLLSWITFTNGPDGDLAGSLTWIKSAGVPKIKFYANGFTNEIDVVGSRYVPPPKGTTILYMLGGEAVFEGGNLANAFTNRVLLDANNVVRNLSTNKLTLTFVTASGAFKGAVTDPLTQKAVTFSGAVLQNQNYGAGAFSDTNQFGRVRFGPTDNESAYFLTTGSSFSPEVTFDTAPELFRWLWSDNTTATNYPVAFKNFGKRGVRGQYLAAFPAGRLTSINLGFDASDDGQATPLTIRTQQNVAAVTFPYPLTSLRFWGSSYNPITNLDFTGFNSLEIIECFYCTNLSQVTVTNLPSLKRVCFEAANLPELDLSGIPTLEDMRAALNPFQAIKLGGGTGPNIWHWCTRDNPALNQNVSEFMTNFYSLRELWIWNDNQHGILAPVSTNLTDVEVQGNSFDSADFTGQRNMHTCLVSFNTLTNLVLTGCTNLHVLDARNNFLPSATLDAILVELDTSAPALISANLSFNAQFPSATGYHSVTNLLNRGVDVVVDYP